MIIIPWNPNSMDQGCNKRADEQDVPQVGKVA